MLPEHDERPTPPSDRFGPVDSSAPEPTPPTHQVHEFGNRTYLVADVEPLDVTGVRTVVVGSAVFLLAALAQLPFLDQLREADRLWWLWTCLMGFGLGIFGFEFCRRRARRLGISLRTGEQTGRAADAEPPVS